MGNFFTTMNSGSPLMEETFQLFSQEVFPTPSYGQSLHKISISYVGFPSCFFKLYVCSFVPSLLVNLCEYIR